MIKIVNLTKIKNLTKIDNKWQEVTKIKMTKESKVVKVAKSDSMCPKTAKNVKNRQRLIKIEEKGQK